MGILLAETGAAAGAAGNDAAAMGGSFMLTVVYLVLMVAVMWFILIGPQKKERKKLAAMLSSLETGDCVLTTSGFIGIVIDINDDTVIVEFGNNKNCRIPMEKSAISRVEKPGEA